MLEFSPMQIVQEIFGGFIVYLCTVAGYFCIIFGSLFYSLRFTNDVEAFQQLRRSAKFPTKFIVAYWIITEKSKGNDFYFFKSLSWRFMGFVIYLGLVTTFLNQIYARYQQNWILLIAYAGYTTLAVVNLFQAWNFGKDLRNNF